jgi:hypothetical protein
MVTSVPWQLASTATKDLARYDRDLTRGPVRGVRYGVGEPRPDGSSPDTSAPHE